MDFVASSGIIKKEREDNINLLVWVYFLSGNGKDSFYHFNLLFLSSSNGQVDVGIIFVVSHFCKAHCVIYSYLNSIM